MTSSCDLCGLSLVQAPIKEGEKRFCCVGCRAVFSILESKGELIQGQHHPLFLQAVEAGLISNPALLDEIRKSQEGLKSEERRQLYLEIQDMWCPACAEILKLTLLQRKGVLNVTVDYATDIAAIEFIPRYVGKDDLFSLISRLGYTPKDLRDRQGEERQTSLLMRLGIAAFCALNIMMFSYPIYASYFFPDREGVVGLLAWLSLLFSLPVIVYCGWPIWRRFASAVPLGIFGMETLVTLGVASAFSLSFYHLMIGSTHVYFDSMTVIVLLVLVGKWFESKAKFTAKESLFRLSRMLPRRARRRNDRGEELFVAIKEVNPGDVLVALTGEKVVLDGVVMEGEASLDESALTGESLPRVVRSGDQVLGGSLVRGGRLVWQVTSSLEESVLQRVVNLVKQDIGRKSAYVRPVDAVVRWFVPVVVLLALLAGLWEGSLEGGVVRAISVLLISCPCALGIAAPLAEARLINRLTDHGVMVRNRGCLRWLGRDTTFFFDKTGTVTEGRFRVLKGLQGLTSREQGVLKAMTKASVHPIALAISEALTTEPMVLESWEELVGLGLRADHGGERYLLGSEKLMEAYGVRAEGVTGRVLFARGESVIAGVELGDEMREEVPGVVASLKATRCVLLSGDSREAVERVKELGGFADAFWRCSPLEKRERVEKCRQGGEVVAVIGDGINDAPALTAAHVGISVVSATDVSIQVSDVLLTTDRLTVLPKLRQLGRFGSRIVAQNLFWAFVYNVVGIGLAMAGCLNPLFSAFAMVASSTMVIFNSSRVYRGPS